MYKNQYDTLMQKNDGTILTVSVALIFDLKARLLLVRKKQTQFFMLAGGKIAENETAQACLIRELKEELDLNISAQDLHFIKTAKAHAANEQDTRICAHIHHLAHAIADPDALQPMAEIDEVRWVTQLQAEDLKLAPLIKQSILPLMKDLSFKFL